MVAGSVRQSSEGTTYYVSNIINHPEYEKDTLKNDVALIKTSSEILFSKLVEKIAFSSEHIGAGVPAVLSGWGFMEGFQVPDNLQFLNLLTIGNDECSSKVPGPFVRESNICTLTTINKGACMGDSGGPLVANNALVGIASWVTYKCAVGYPDGFTRVSSYANWIRNNTS